MSESPEEPDPLAFTPVASASTRHDGWTPERQRVFIDTLAATGSVTGAARAAGKSATAAYKLRERPGADQFGRAWEIAQQMAYDRAFEVAVTARSTAMTRPASTADGRSGPCAVMTIG